MSLFGVEGRLAHAYLTASIPRLGISVAALSMSLSMMVAIAVMVASFRETVIYWVGQTLQADLFVSPGRLDSAAGAPTISPEVERVVSAHPAVAAIDRFRRRELSYEGALVGVSSGDMQIRRDFGGMLFKERAPDGDPIQACIGADAVLVSESFSIRRGKNAGDSLRLQTLQGLRAFHITGVFYDYSSDRGIITMDNQTFERHFGSQAPTGMTVYLRSGSSPEAVRSEILAGIGDRYRVFINTNAGLRREILRIFDSTFAITYALEAIAVFVAMLGVATTLHTLILERRRELAVLRLLGADRRQIRKMVVIEACLMGGASQCIGIAVGLVLSLLLVYVINVQSFGWTLQFHVPVWFLLQMSGLILLATAVAGIYPARRAALPPAASDGAQE
jgi:putative ABC transport system permease protein